MADKSLYCGITTDLNRRLNEHNTGKLGARYTRSRLPAKLVYSETQENRSAATKREIAIKKMTRKDKLKLIASSSV